MTNENTKSNQIWMKLGTRGFSRSQIIQNGGSNTVDQNAESCSFWSRFRRYLGVFEIAGYESKHKIRKFKMGNPMWRTKTESDLI